MYIVETLSANATVQDLETTLRQQEQLGDRMVVSVAATTIAGAPGNLLILRLLDRNEAAPTDAINLRTVTGDAQRIQAVANGAGGAVIGCVGLLVQGQPANVLVWR